MTLKIAIGPLGDDLFLSGRARRLMWSLLFASFPCAGEIFATPRVEQRTGGIAIANDHLRVLVEKGAVRSVENVMTGEQLLYWQSEEPIWYVEFGRRRVSGSARGEITITESADRVQLRITTSIPPPDDVTAVTTVTLGRDPWVEMSIDVENRSSQEIELVGFPANALSAKSPRKYLAYPYQSGVILPLDERLETMRIYGKLPFVLGYPSNVCSMQWMGLYEGQGGLMLMNTDRYGALKRMGVIDGGQHARLVIEHQASLAPGKRFTLPTWRMVAIPSGGYRRMCDVYRKWIRERTAVDATVIRDRVNGTEKIPLQFIPLRHKLDAPDIQRTIPAEMSRRGSAMFGAIHQVISWGGVHWAGVGYHRLRGRTWMIVRDNTARRDIFGKRPAYRMFAPDGQETTDIFAVRETSWLDTAGQVIGVHWDNNSGCTAEAEAVLGKSRIDVSEMWGTAELLPSSLNRLYKGATVTLLDGGNVALWNSDQTSPRPWF